MLIVLSACPLDTRDMEVLAEWQSCVECMDGELNRVIDRRSLFKERAWRDTLTRFVLNDPSGSLLAAIQSAAEARYDEIAASGVSTSLSLTRDEYAARQIQRYSLSHRSRAAVALRTMFGPNGVRIIDSAAQHSTDSTARRVLKSVQR